MKRVEILQVTNGFIVKTYGIGYVELVFKNYDEVVQKLAQHFNQCGVGKTWVTDAERDDGK